MHSAFRSSCQFARRLLDGSRNLHLKRKLEVTKPCQSSVTGNLVLRSLAMLPEPDTVTILQDSLASNLRPIESVAKLNSYSKFPQSVTVQRLSSRRLLKIRGPDATKFLQKLVTTDVTQMAIVPERNPCRYTMLLSKEGRVLYDVLLYKMFKDEYWLEYDAIAVIPLQKHLDIFRLKKQVITEPVDSMSVWAAYRSLSEDDATEDPALDAHRFVSHLRIRLAEHIVLEDPRVSELGCRIILPDSIDLCTELRDFSLKPATPDDCYEIQRYKLGIGEGVKDHPPQECLPLECNLDYLGGIDFDKGWHLGQELTTRIHETSFVRRRLMPVVLSKSRTSCATEGQCFPADCALINQKGLMMGRLRNNFGVYGLAVLRVKAALEDDSVKLKGFNVSTKVIRPNWWPRKSAQDSHQSYADLNY